MNEQKKKWKLAQLAKEFNVSLERIKEILDKEGYKNYKCKPNERIPEDIAHKVARHFKMDQRFKEMVEQVRLREKRKEEKEKQEIKKEKEKIENTKEKNTEKEKQETTIKTEAQQTQEKQVKKIEKNTEKEKQEIKKEKPKLNIVRKVNLDEIDTSTRPKKRSTKKAKTKTTTDKKEKNLQKTEVSTEKDIAENVIKRLDELENDIQEKKQEIEKNKTLPKKEKITEVIENKEDVKKDTQKTQETSINAQREQKRELEIKKPKVIRVVDLDKIEKKTKKPKEDKQEKISHQTKEHKSKHSSKKEKKKRVEKVDIEKEGRRIKKIPKKKKSNKEVIIDKKEIDKSYKETIQQTKGHTGKSIAKQKYEKKKLKTEEKLRREQDIENQSRKITITEFITINQLANLINADPIELMQKALQLGIKANLNYPLEAEEIELLAEEYGYEVEFVDIITLEELEAEIKDNPENLQPRPPIVTVMGHVDHGKTSLLDYIRKSNIVAGEAGGITQHIGAYNITFGNNSITFIDTPGHEAFTAMRARGAKVTDIAVIVVAADDGVRPQTDEALDHAKAAGVPIIFAINKMDKETANPEKVRRELSERGYLVSSWGGDYFDVEVSAKTGYNIDELLETILLLAEDLNLQANPKRPAVGTVLEAQIEKGRGTVTNILVRTGTLKKGDIILAGSYYGRVKAMFNERMKAIKSAGPSIPAQVLGINGVPEPGVPFVVMPNEKEAKQKAKQREQIKRVIERRSNKLLSLEEISRRLQQGEFNEINIIIRADVLGTAEALADQLEKLSTDQIKVNVIRKATGEITENDVMLAQVAKAIIIGFQVRPSVQARKAAEDKQVEIRTYSIIYQAIDDIKNAIKGLLKPIQKEEFLGSAKVLQTFKIKGVGTIAGCRVEQGKVVRDARVRVVRNGIIIYEGEIESLKRYQKDVEEVKAPQECGIGIKKFNDVKIDDIIEFFKIIEIEQKI